jgi:SMI1 / KNR4 family (SUKH-1)
VEISQIIEKMKDEWPLLKTTVHENAKVGEFELVCTFSDNGINVNELNDININLPEAIIEFWKITESAELFLDKRYGQWGLHILSLNKSLVSTKEFRTERSRDFKKSDLVIGKFIGDSEMLLLRCDINSNDYGKIICADPIDSREDWYEVSKSFDIFLKEYLDSKGDKYWERNR